MKLPKFCYLSIFFILLFPTNTFKPIDRLWLYYPEIIQNMNQDVPNESSSSCMSLKSSTLIKSFSGLKLRKELLNSISSYGLEKPSRLQQEAIYPIIEGQNVIIQAPSGTGKTTALVIGILQQLNFCMVSLYPNKASLLSDVKKTSYHVMVVVTKREVARAIRGVVMALGKEQGVSCCTCTDTDDVDVDGGTEGGMEGGANVVVGTPSRLLHAVQQGIISLQELRVFAVDEADDICKRGFKNDLSVLMEMLSADVHLMLNFRKLSEKVTQLIKAYVNDPVNVLVEEEKSDLKGLPIFYTCITFTSICQYLCNFQFWLNVYEKVLWKISETFLRLCTFCFQMHLIYFLDFLFHLVTDKNVLKDFGNLKENKNYFLQDTLFAQIISRH